MRVEVFDVRREWLKEYSHRDGSLSIKKGGIMVYFSSDPDTKKEGEALRSFRLASVVVLHNPPPGTLVDVLSESYSGDLRIQFGIHYHIYSTDGEDSPIEWFKTAADLLAMFGQYFIPSITQATTA
ncbi:MAG: hypothetical protein Q8R29_00385 [bacterium]|nr:hypothetical protein [bacterium]